MNIDLTQLLQTLVGRFDLEELRTLCFDLDVDFDNLRGESKAGKARELVLYMKRHQQLDRLAARVEELRPDVPEAHVAGEVSGPRRAGERRERRERKTASLHTQLETARDNFLLIRERKSQYVMETDVPLDLVKRERQLERLIAELETQLSALKNSIHIAGLDGAIRERWALLVGVDRYVDPAIPPLRFCVNDVLALGRTLKRLGYTVVALHDDADEEWLLPTRDNVEAELARLCQAAGPDDLLLVHFACHGKLVNGQPLLVTRETRVPTLVKKALPLAEVERQMRESQARRLVLTLDACHTGVEIGRDLADPEFIRNVYELAEGFALIAASTAQQVAQEWDEQEHGVFTYYLLEGLSGKADRVGKGFVTVDDLKTHVLDGLRRWNVEHWGLVQEPTARTEGLGDIILADYR